MIRIAFCNKTEDAWPSGRAEGSVPSAGPAAAEAPTVPGGAELAFLNEVATAVGGARNLRQLLRQTGRKIMALAHYDGLAFFLADRQRSEAQLVLSMGVGAQTLRQTGASVPFGQGFAGRVCLNGKPIYASDFQAAEGRAWKVRLDRLGVRTFASIPLRARHGVVGVLDLLSRTGREITGEERRVLEALGSMLGVAVDNAQLHETTQRSAHEHMVLYDESPDMYHAVDPEGRIVRCNATEAQMLGFSKDELIGLEWKQLCTDEGWADIEPRLAEFRSNSGAPFTVETEVRHRDGHLLHVSLRVAPVFEGGIYRGARVVMRDMTHQKQLERQLVQAQKMESLGTLAGGIAHDFNNLLTGMIGYASLIKRKTAADDILHRYADTIEKSGQRAADLTRQMLAFARTHTLQSAIININDVVRETAALLSHSMEKQIVLEMVLDDDLHPVAADPVQMEQVLLNLCVNARDAMRDGGKLTITTRNGRPEKVYSVRWSTDPPERCVTLTVADTGHGMDDITRERIFDPFFTTKEPGCGTGLGLAMVYGIVTQHNGHIEVESEVGAGTTFHVFLPAVAETAASKITETDERRLPHYLRVLVVDDEPDIRTLMKDTLTALGLTVHTVESGQEAVEFYRERAPEVDLVLMDMMMPDMDGRETFWQLRATDPGVRVLLMSGYSDDETVGSLLQSGARGFLRKPWNRAGLITAIREAME